MQASYWGNNGTHQALADRLQRLLPFQGPVSFPRSDNKALERFRVAANCYYDLYNNGLMNRAAQFKRVFNIRQLSMYKYPSGEWTQLLKYNVEDKMNEFVLEAAKEQGML